jgi:hypothetical protein
MKTLRGTSSADLRLVLDEIKELRPQDIRRGVLIEYPERDLKLSYLFPKLGRLYFQARKLPNLRLILQRERRAKPEAKSSSLLRNRPLNIVAGTPALVR